MIKKTEILAPCGSYDILVAAIKAGADACYIGGNKFGARAYAENLNNDSIVRAIDYAHLHDVKLYLTVNTLFKENEINELYDYLLPYYKAGLDACIVQDFGAFSYIKQCFPEISVHCSTQMNITSIHAAKRMYELGASRIVTAREMQLSEIAYIKKHLPKLELESFVHGAMCYSYSGQCLMSSLAGGRSGNRGRCAQPCRKCYDNQYSLSMKDMCTLEDIPKIIQAGVDSLKIEGRMKNEYYVASTVDAYREMRDDYYNNCFDIKKAILLKEKLANIYNRGGFCSGYYFIHNGKEMISIDRPNNQGVCIGKLKKTENGSVVIHLTQDLFKGDVLELRLKDKSVIEITSNSNKKAGDNVTLQAPKTKYLQQNQVIYRTRCNKILSEIENDILNINKKILLHGEFVGKKNESFTLSIWNQKACVQIKEGLAEISEKQSTNIDTIKEKLSQLGNTEYSFETLTVTIEDDVFVPMGLLKKMRRKAISLLEEKICMAHRRENINEKENISNISKEPYHIPNQDTPKCHVHVTNMEQLKYMINKQEIDRIYCNKTLFSNISSSDIALEQELFLELPFVIRNDFSFEKFMDSININIVDGFYVRNIDGFYGLIQNPFFQNYFKDKTIVCGFSLYVYNSKAFQFFVNEIGRMCKIEFEAPKELNLNEIKALNYPFIMPVYGYDQVMISAQCVQKTLEFCTKDNSMRKMTDEKGNIFYSKAMCDECINVIYNGTLFSLLDRISSCNIPFQAYSYHFIMENTKEIDDILSNWQYNKPHTTGHFNRGVV